MNKKFVDKKSLETGKKAEESFSKISKSPLYFQSK